MKRILLALATAALAVIAVAAPATAAAPPATAPVAGPFGIGSPDCKGPVPEIPGRGAISWVLPRPASTPHAGDPFTPGSGTSVFEQYGFAGSGDRFHVCDLDDGTSLGRLVPDTASPQAFSSSIADELWLNAMMWLGFTVALINMAFAPEQWLSAFYPLATNAVHALSQALFEPAGQFAFAALGLFTLWKARKARIGEALSAFGMAVLVTLGIVLVIMAPVALIRTVSAIPPMVIGQVNAHISGQVAPGQTSTTDPATATAGALFDAVAYQRWLEATFGDPTSDAAKKYAPALYDSTAFTWAEADRTAHDPAARKKLIEAKQAKYADTMAKIKDADPDAYEYASGRRSNDRVIEAVASNVSALAALPFLVFACLLLIACYIVIVVAILLYVGSAIFGILPKMGRFATGPIAMVGAAMMNAIAMGIGCAIEMLAIRILLDPASGLPLWQALVLIAILSVVLWCALKPLRRLWDMFHGGDAKRAARHAGRGASIAGTVGKAVLGGATTAIGVKAGEMWARRGQNAVVEDTQVPGPPPPLALPPGRTPLALGGGTWNQSPAREHPAYGYGPRAARAHPGEAATAGAIENIYTPDKIHAPVTQTAPWDGPPAAGEIPASSQTAPPPPRVVQADADGTYVMYTGAGTQSVNVPPPAPLPPRRPTSPDDASASTPALYTGAPGATMVAPPRPVVMDQAHGGVQFLRGAIARQQQARALHDDGLSASDGSDWTREVDAAERMVHDQLLAQGYPADEAQRLARDIRNDIERGTE